ncbi:hypothetical protein [Crystallibacter degradans]|uniref:hypothetical protein n=1 Tax=Crystallibacter degradans TaxID=2726743 RepID=UPI0014735C18|nr:hypothetical protein [Arthrobacter sp. SF27]NMR30074.1 hypothetical protein [Arthrobacter sp. SF27]
MDPMTDLITSDGQPSPKSAVTQWPVSVASTEDESVDEIIEPLTSLPQVPVTEHAAVFTCMHDGLLADLDAGAD